MRKKTAVVLIGNEVVMGVLESVLRRVGYEVCRGTETVGSADLAVITAYFMELGVLNQLRLANPNLPIVLITHSGYKVTGNEKFFYDIVELDGRSAIETDEKITRWFLEGQGKYLIQSGGSGNSYRS